MLTSEITPVKLSREYTITSKEDSIHISNGRCPHYALSWGYETNKDYWPVNHDYFIGNDNFLNIDGYKELREIFSRKLKYGKLNKPLIFCDFEGVLTDYQNAVIKKYKGRNLYTNYSKPSIFNQYSCEDNFYETIPWFMNGKEFWNKIKEYDPIILTGVSHVSNMESEQKRKWCERELGANVEVITCPGKEKAKYCLPGSILIDNRISNLSNWVKKGGKFILYDYNYGDAICEEIQKHLNMINNLSPNSMLENSFPYVVSL